VDEDDGDTVTEVQTYKFVPAQNLFGDRKILKFRSVTNVRDESTLYNLDSGGVVLSNLVHVAFFMQVDANRIIAYGRFVGLVRFSSSTFIPLLSSLLMVIFVIDSRVKAARRTRAETCRILASCFVFLVRVPILRPPPLPRRPPSY